MNSPALCPLQIALVARKLDWALDGAYLADEAAAAAEDTLSVVESFRDVFAVRKSQKILTSSRIPSSPLVLEKWLAWLYTDLLTVLFCAKLNDGLQRDAGRQRRCTGRSRSSSRRSSSRVSTASLSRPSMRTMSRRSFSSASRATAWPRRSSTCRCHSFGLRRRRSSSSARAACSRRLRQM